MEHLLASRVSRDEELGRLENLSPQKFGKGAYCHLTYTPSKLADNVLYKEVTTLKKVEEGSSKFRESEALNSFLKDRLKQLQVERDGIEQSLTQQIVMYKKMLHEMEDKHEQRIREVQRGFSEEMQRVIIAKEEEVKYAQSEKELLQNRIYELENALADLKEELNQGSSNFDSLTKEHEKLQIHFKNIQERLDESQKRGREQAEKAKAENEELSRKLYNCEVDFRGKLEKAQLEREKEKEAAERLQRSELEKVENKRAQELLMKNQQIKDLASTFEAEAGRLNDIISCKERMIEGLGRSVSEEKQKLLDLTRSYTAEVSNLAHEKSRLRQEVDALSAELEHVREEKRVTEGISAKREAGLEAYIGKLKDELELTQVSLIRERDRSGFMADDLQREVILLQNENSDLNALAGENSILCKEIRNLKELLLESSMEMQKCKDEFVRLAREKDHLLIRLRELGLQNQTLQRIKFEREEEAKGWRDSYYLSRR